MDKKKILVVDDERDVLTVLERRLSKAGYDVVKAQNGTEALKLAKSEFPDLILLDILMPDINGADVAAVLKKDPLTQKIPIIFLTCLYTRADETQQGHEVAGNFFIAKPFNPDELLTEIKKRL